MPPRVTVRILGLAHARRGFGFAVTEGPRLLVASGLRRTPISQVRMVQRLSAVIQISRPLFVAFETERMKCYRQRGKTLCRAVHQACQNCGVMCLSVESRQVCELTDLRNPSKFRVAEAVAKLFPQLAPKLPPRRSAWLPEDPRIGLFIAVAAAVCAWDGFRKGRW